MIKIFEDCLKQAVSNEYFVTVKPTRVTETAISVSCTSLEVLKLKHPYDLEICRKKVFPICSDSSQGCEIRCYFNDLWRDTNGVVPYISY